MKMKHILLSAVAGAFLAASAASAQQAAAPTGETARPEINQVGDWFVRCFAVQSPSPCDVYQELDNQNTRQRIMSVSIAFVPSMNRHALQVTVPLEVSLPKGLTIQAEGFTSPVMRYRRCDRNGCYVELAVENALVESLSKGGASAKVNIVADGGKPYVIPFSLKGFAAAHDEMAEKARAKAKPVAKAGDAPVAPAPTP